MMAKKPKIFVDSSVLVSAVLGKEGASSYIFSLGESAYVGLVFTVNVVKEATDSLARKYGSDGVSSLVELLMNQKDSIKPRIKEEQDVELLSIVSDPKDVHILRGADKYQVDFLVTLDRRHLLSDKMHNANLHFKALLPGDFLKIFRKNWEK